MSLHCTRRYIEMYTKFILINILSIKIMTPACGIVLLPLNISSENTEFICFPCSCKQKPNQIKSSPQFLKLIMQDVFKWFVPGNVASCGQLMLSFIAILVTLNIQSCMLGLLKNLKLLLLFCLFCCCCFYLIENIITIQYLNIHTPSICMSILK